MARYIIEFMFCSGLFVALYKLLIKGRVAHHQARMYLVGAMFLSVIIPMLELPLYPAHTVYFELPIINSDVQNLPSSTVVSDAAPAVQSAAQTDWRRILSIVAWGIYILVFALNIARFVYRLWVIRRLRLCAQLTVYEAYTLAVSERISEPFSFWRTIYMNRHFVGREREQIIVHELSHILHHHTAERLSVELLRCVFWFNPFVWLVGNYLVEVQEWEADSDVLSRGYDVYEYRQLIFRQLFGYNTDITCGLNSQLTKNRFLMMTNFKKGKLSFMRFGVAILMVGAMILAFGACRAEAGPTAPNTPTPVVQNLPDEEKSTVYISADGKIMLDGEVVALDKFEKRYKAYLRKVGGGVFISFKADDNADIDLVNDVKDIIDKFVVIRNKPKSSELTSTVYISADGKITLNGEALTLEELQTKLKKFRADKGESAVLTIKADEKTRLGLVKDVKDVARKVNVLRIKYDMSERMSFELTSGDKEYSVVAVAGDITLGTHRPMGFDTKREWTKVDGKTAEMISRGTPTFIFKSDTQLEVITPVEVDFVKAGLYSYSVNNGKLYIKGAKEYAFPCQIRYRGTDYDIHLGVDTEMYGVKLTKIILK